MLRVSDGSEDGVEREDNLPCMQPCRITAVQAGKEQAIQVPVRPGRCPLGFSRLQIGILSLVKSNPGVLAYWQFAEILGTAWSLEITESAVRGAISRMPRHAFLLRSRARTLSHSGNLYTLSADPCSHISPLTESVRYSVQTGGHAGNCNSLSSRQIEIKDLSVSWDHATLRLLALSESDYALHWPKLATAGVGVSLIEQAVAALRKLGKSMDKIIEGLDHAEWELEHGTMFDKEGRQVADPASWVFRALATNGSYRRPKGYVSPEEQKLLDATEEANRRKAALEIWLVQEFELWRNMLAPDEIEGLLPQPKPSEPSIRESLLRAHFRKHVWPEILTAKSFGQPTPCGHGPLSGAGRGLCPSEPREDEGREPEA